MSMISWQLQEAKIRNDAVQFYGAGSRNSVRVIHK